MSKKEKKSKKEAKHKKMCYKQVTDAGVNIAADMLAAYIIGLATAQKDEYERFDNYTEFNSFLSSNAQHQNHILNMKTRKAHIVRRAFEDCVFNVDTEDDITISLEALFADWCFIDGTPCGKRIAKEV